MSTNTDSREVSRAFGRRQCRTCDGSGSIPSDTPLTICIGDVRFKANHGLTDRDPCPECAERDAEARRLDQCQRSYQRAMLLCWLVPLTLVGLALAWVMWRMLSGRWGL